jgi:hypothetical protein
MFVKNLILIICASAAFTTVAQIPVSISVFAQDGEKFWLILDGIRQNDKPEANVKVTGLIKDNYRLKVIFDDSRISSIDQNIYTKWGYEATPVDATYVIRKNNKGKYVMRGNSVQEAQAPQAPAAGQSVISFHTTENPKETAGASTPDPVKDETIHTKTTTTVSATQTSDKNIPQNINAGVNVNMSATGVNINIQDPVMGENINMGVNTTGLNSTTTYTTTTTTTTTSSGNQSGGVAAPKQNTVQPEQPTAKVAAGCSSPMSSGDFANAKSSIQKQSFAETQYKTAQQITRNNCLSVAQVKEIIQLFSFERNRLDFAKFAYDFTTDKKNYYMVNDVFSFSSSVDELNDFIDKK